MELREFVSSYFTLAKTSDELARSLHAAAQEAGDEAIDYEFGFSTNNPFLNQIMLSRATESFDLYLTMILRDIFLARPEMLKSEGTIDIATVIETGNYEELIWKIAERKVLELSYKPLSELRKFIQSRTSVDLFPSQAAFETTLVASEVRNLIAHNDCLVSDVFRARTKGISMPLVVSSTGRVKIDNAWLQKASFMLDDIVFRFDKLAADKFNLRTLFRMGAFILRD